MNELISVLIALGIGVTKVVFIVACVGLAFSVLAAWERQGPRGPDALA